MKVTDFISPKANGSYRMCIYFRKVNQGTFPQYQSLVSVTEVVDVFGERKSRIFSTLDMFSGYHHVKIAEDSKKFTGFTTPDGEHLAFNRLCFGLCNAPAHFLCPIQGLFQHSINRYCQVYLDDVIIFSPNVSQDIVERRVTLFVLKKAGFKLNPAKWAFVQVKVKYLGHWFSREGYGMDPKIVEAVRSFKEIKNAR